MSAVDVLIALLLLIPLGLIAVLLLFAEYLDWHSRLEIMERRHPKLTRLINDRPFRLVLLCMVFAMLGLDLKQTLKQPVIESPNFKFPVPTVPAIAQSSAQQPDVRNIRFKERAFNLISQIRKLAEEQRQTELETFWAYGAAQGPTGVLTVGTDREKRNWQEGQRRRQEDSFKFYRQKYHDAFMTDAKNLREALLQRLPPGTRDDTLIYEYNEGFGYAGMDKVAADLERLVNMIPDN